MKLSIITINLNKAAGLQATIDSVLKQSFSDYEFIVVDGGSSDGSLDIINAIRHKLAAWSSEPDSGIYDAMNKGIRMATGEFVCFMNSGDRFWTDSVLEQVFSSPLGDAALIYGDVMRADRTGTVRLLEQPTRLTVAQFFGFGICHQSIFYKRDLFTLLGPYDASLKMAGDWDFTLRVLLAGKPTLHVPIPVVHYEGGGVSDGDPTVITHREEEKHSVLSRHLPPAVYHDYQQLRLLERETARLKTFEDWARLIRDRNLLVNLAMVTRWAWLRLYRGRNVPL